MLRSQEQGIHNIKDLMQSHYDALDNRIMEIRQAVKDQADIIHPRLNKVEQDMVAIKTEIGAYGLDARISDHADVKWVRGYKGFLAGVAAIVVAALLVGGFNWWRTHDMSSKQSDIVTKGE